MICYSDYIQNVKFLAMTGITHGIEGFLKHQQRSWEADDQHRLRSQEAEDDSLDAGGDQELRHTHHAVHLISWKKTDHIQNVSVQTLDQGFSKRMPWHNSPGVPWEYFDNIWKSSV